MAPIHTLGSVLSKLEQGVSLCPQVLGSQPWASTQLRNVSLSAFSGHHSGDSFLSILTEPVPSIVQLPLEILPAPPSPQERKLCFSLIVKSLSISLMCPSCCNGLSFKDSLSLNSDFLLFDTRFSSLSFPICKGSEQRKNNCASTDTFPACGFRESKYYWFVSNIKSQRYAHFFRSWIKWGKLNGLKYGYRPNSQEVKAGELPVWSSLGKHCYKRKKSVSHCS